MLQGTGSNVGKSLLVAGLCRLARRQGLSVAPFKPQNMANNAAVTPDGGEIGRAQALQARAAGLAPSIDMNPVLLKPQSETGAQLVVRGKVAGTARAKDYQTRKQSLLPAVLESFGRLRAHHDLVIVEGAGSASEVNLRAGDIANMGFARAADVPVVLIGDIDRGGVIASLVGTKHVILAEDADMISGFLVNKMRGDLTLFDEGMRTIESMTGWPALGLIPYFEPARRLPAEDAYDLAERSGALRREGGLKIAVPLYPRIANFDDLDPLAGESAIDLQLVPSGKPLPGDAALVILPGSKATIADLAALRREGWDIDLLAHRRRGGRILGLCGGYQMLGRRLADPDGIEGPPSAVEGLGLLDVETELKGDKHLVAVEGQSLPDTVPFHGYEMHIGCTEGLDRQRPLLRFADGRGDGAQSADGLVMGSYAHGLFADDRQRAAWLRRLGAGLSDYAHEAAIEETLDGLTEHLSQHLDSTRLFGLAR
ncbi:MAG: cobyric acid synthase [Rhodospirillales bacterium]|nr:cobyric acid synthase [Rhodospirillales bacterium]